MGVSVVGGGFYQVALVWQVYGLSDTPTALSIVNAAALVPNVLLVLLAGVVTDHADRRKVLVVADTLRGVAVGLIGVLAVSGARQLSVEKQSRIDRAICRLTQRVAAVPLARASCALICEAHRRRGTSGCGAPGAVVSGRHGELVLGDSALVHALGDLRPLLARSQGQRLPPGHFSSRAEWLRSGGYSTRTAWPAT